MTVKVILARTKFGEFSTCASMSLKFVLAKISSLKVLIYRCTLLVKLKCLNIKKYKSLSYKLYILSKSQGHSKKKSMKCYGHFNIRLISLEYTPPLRPSLWQPFLITQRVYMTVYMKVFGQILGYKKNKDFNHFKKTLKMSRFQNEENPGQTWLQSTNTKSDRNLWCLQGTWRRYLQFLLVEEYETNIQIALHFKCEGGETKGVIIN